MRSRRRFGNGFWLNSAEQITPAPQMRFLRHPIRLSLRFVWLCGEFVVAGLTYVSMIALRRSGYRPPSRAYWLQQSCRRVLRVLNVGVEVRGPIPTSGLLVCNHLSYLDILVLSALTPAVFVAKREVKSWPVLGCFAALAGTIFVDRQRRTQTGKTAEQIKAVLDRGALVVLFPEGTSSDGKTVLPFKTSLLKPATKATRPLSAGVLQYEIEDGDAGEEICYWKDMTFLPHLLNLLTKKRILARVGLSQVDRITTCRKAMARQLHSEVSRLNAMRYSTEGAGATAQMTEIETSPVHHLAICESTQPRARSARPGYGPEPRRAGRLLEFQAGSLSRRLSLL